MFLERTVAIMDKSKCISMSIRVSSEELETIKKAAEIEKYSGYSEFVRRTVLIKACQIVAENDAKGKNE